MPISRRSFLAEAAAASFLPSFLSNAQVAHHMARAADEKASSSPTAGETYWTNLYHSAAQRGGGMPEFGNDLREPRFAYFDADKKGLNWAEDNDAKSLPSFEDDAVVTLELCGFRAGKTDEQNLNSVRYAQMHLSCQQVEGAAFVGPLAWAALATVFANQANKLPSMQDLNAAPADRTQAMPGTPQLNRVLLPDGAGHLSVNVTTTPPASMLDKILNVTMNVAKVLSPLMGFPAVSLPALGAFYTFYGNLEKANPHNFLINTSLKDVAVTQQGADNSNVSAQAIKLRTGYYVLIPKSQESLLTSGMSDLIVQNGYLVQRKDVGSSMAVDDRVANAVPNLTYVTLHADIKPKSAFSSSTGTSRNGA